MKFMRPKTSFHNGFSLIEVIVALGIASIAGLGLMSFFSTGMKANKSNDLGADLLELRRTITNKISCDHTLGLTRPSACSGAQVLKDKLDRPIAPNGRIGPWTVEALCESVDGRNGLSIYATKKTSTGSFAVDPIRNLPFNRQHPSSSLFDHTASPCSNSFLTPSASCPNRIESINFEDRTVVCAKLNIQPTCPAGSYLNAVVDNNPICRRPMICVAFNGRATGAGNQGGANSPNEDCQNKGGNPDTGFGGFIQSVTNRYCMSPHSTNSSYAQHGDCSNRGGSGKCGCWSCQADGIECYQP
jgi:prepilin-type N-terminal cleavage/methylation domain-containing protein